MSARGHGQAALLEHLLRLALRRLDACQKERLAPLALTPRQVEVLMALKGQGGVRQRELARRVGMDASTLAELAARLARRGLIRRAPHRKDRRALALYLTPKGRRVVQKALPLMAEADAVFLKPLRAAQRQAFVQALMLLGGESQQDDAALARRREGEKKA